MTFHWAKDAKNIFLLEKRKLMTGLRSVVTVKIGSILYLVFESLVSFSEPEVISAVVNRAIAAERAAK